MIGSPQLLALLVACLAAVSCSAFAPVQQQQRSTTTTTSSSSLGMAPKWDGDKWLPNSDAEGPSAGYNAGKTLLLHGPLPFYNRIFKGGDYEQAVLKFMAGEKCDRDEAQGNMDFYLANPSDWAFNRFEMEKKGVKYDYVTLKQEALALTLVWSTLVVAVSTNTILSLTTDYGFWDFLK